MIDLVALPLGTALTLRFWYALLGVQDPFLITIWTAAALCEMTRRLIDARRDWQRPMIFCAERKFDLTAAVLLGAGPWPIALPVNDGAPLASVWQLAVPGWLAPAVAVAVLATAIHRLVVSSRSQRASGAIALPIDRLNAGTSCSISRL